VQIQGDFVKHSGRAPSYSCKQLLLIWLLSFVFWTGVVIFWELSMSKWRQSLGIPRPKNELALLLINQWIFAVLSPLIYLSAVGRPLDKKSFLRRMPGYLLGGFIFVAFHVAIRVLVYPVRDPRTGVEFGLFQPAGLCFCAFKAVFLYDLVDDLYQVYLPVILIAHAVIYHHRSQAEAVRVLDLEKQLTQAQLLTLKMELHPHFLFNSMSSISALMYIDVDEADRMLTGLGDLLRQTLENKGVQEITLREELEFLETYLSIEQIRLRERLSTQFLIHPETLDAMVPHLLLQPLVENAIRHALSKRISGGTLTITSARVDDRLRLLVMDNGTGTSQGVDTPDRHSGGLGLKITQDRLQALYRGDFSFEVHPNGSRGMEVIIEIPFHADSAKQVQIRELRSTS
jgi:two-component system LytT family sensor kinase